MACAPNLTVTGPYIIGIPLLASGNVPHIIGRVMSLLMFGSLGLVPLSYAVSGFIASLGVGVLLPASGASVLLVAAWSATVKPLRDIE